MKRLSCVLLVVLLVALTATPCFAESPWNRYVNPWLNKAGNAFWRVGFSRIGGQRGTQTYRWFFGR